METQKNHPIWRSEASPIHTVYLCKQHDMHCCISHEPCALCIHQRRWKSAFISRSTHHFFMHCICGYVCICIFICIFIYIEICKYIFFQLSACFVGAVLCAVFCVHFLYLLMFTNWDPVALGPSPTPINCFYKY